MTSFVQWCCMGPAVLCLLLYVCGIARLWRRAGFARGLQPRHVALFVAGWTCAAVPAFGSLAALGLRSFTVHMIEHELLMVVAAPLLVLSRPLPVFAWSLGPAARRRLHRATHHAFARSTWHALTDVRLATLLHALAIWSWHLPGPFRAAMQSLPLHFVQHLSFFGTALLFWWATISREAFRRRPVAGAMALFATLFHSGLLGALLTFSRAYWYPAPLPPGVDIGFCGLDRAQDQQLAGLVMWVPGALAYLVAGLALLAAPLRASTSMPEAPRRPRQPGAPTRTTGFSAGTP